MKEIRIATGAMGYMFYFVFGLGFFIETNIHRYDDHQMVKHVTYYFLCFKLVTNQHYRTFLTK